ncbi:MAG: BtaA family protein [Bacilli bacterium]|nr:BtaA family protein [Bacilli bacterium]
MSVTQNLDMARKIIEKKQSGASFNFSEYNKASIKGTENIRGVLKQVSTPLDRSLVVRGAGDQTLEVVRYGGKIIHNFDINHLTEPGAGLKYGAVRALNYEELLEFYGAFQNTYFAQRLYEKMQQYLDADTRIFFNALLAQYGPRAIMHYFFDRDNHKIYIPHQIASIYIPEEYDEIRRRLLSAQIRFTQSNIDELGEKKEGEKYDFVYLSNIMYYLQKSFAEYAALLKENVVPLLAEEGTIIAHYLYGGFLKKSDAMLYHIGCKEIAEERLDTFCEILEDTTGLDVERYSVPCSGYGRTIPGKDDIAIALTRRRK